MNDWNIVDWTWDEHMLRARMQFGAFWPAADEDLTQELGHDGQGAFNSKSFCQAYMCGGKANCTAVLEGAGLNRMLRKNDVFLYFGDDDGQPTAFKYSLFRYAHGVPEEGGVVDDLNAPDDPASLAPRRAVELCAMLVKEVVSYERQDGVDGRCTWVLGQAFSMARHLRRCYSKRYERIADDLDSLHPREHVLTDLWQAARLHNVVAVGCLRTVCEWRSVIPPPVGLPDDAPLFWRPGCVHFLDKVRNSVSKQRLEWRRDPRVRLCTCDADGCTRPKYDCGEDVMARCAACERWFHEKCVDYAEEGQVFRALNVEWPGGGVAGPATRRSPNEAEPVFQGALRGLDVRVDPPVRSWERLAAGVTEARYWVDVEADDGGHDFREAWRDAVKGNGTETGSIQISDSETDEAIQEIESGGGEIAGMASPLVCPFCHAPM